MSKQLNLISDLTALGAAIKANTKAHGKVDAQWHVLACSAIDAFDKHGNVHYVNAVYAALGKGARHKAMIEFFLAFGGVMANTGEGKDQTPFIKDPSKKADLATACKTPWYTMAPSKKPDEVVDYLKLALKLVSKAPTDKQTTEHGALRGLMSEVVRTYVEANGIEGVEVPSVATESEDDVLADVTE
jgi:hypothetical protein